MEENIDMNTVGTLKEMTEQTLTNRPEDAQNAIDEYFLNFEEDNAEDQKRLVALKEQLTNEKYLAQFKTAIIQSSLMVFIAAFKVTQDKVNIDFDKYTREFLAYAQKDDKTIYEMRTFYLENLNAQEIGIGFVPPPEDGSTPPELSEDVKKAISQSQEEYDNLMIKLLRAYKDTKIHLI